MRKLIKMRALTLITTLALALTLLPETVWAAEPNNTEEHNGIKVVAVNSGSVTYTKGSGFTLTANGDYIISGTWDTSPSEHSITADNAVIKVPGGVTADVTLSNINIDVSATINACAFAVAAGGKANITLSGTSALNSGNHCAGLQVPESAEVAIGGSGTLNATGRLSGAGIGGGAGGGGGTITITEGTVNAFGDAFGAGIGGGAGGGGGAVIITGNAQINATGKIGGAGIGGGAGGGGGTVTISGNARVNATATADTPTLQSGAGIGGGENGGGGTVTISGSTVVNATAQYGGSGIGGGYNGGGGNTIITGGTVKAVAGSDACRIGPGYGGSGFDTYICTVKLDSQSFGTDAAATKSLLLGDDGNFTVTGAVSLPENLEIPNNSTLTILNSSILTVPNGKILTNNGAITGSGTITNNGTIDGSGTINGVNITGNKAARTINLPGAAQVDITSVTLNSATPSAGAGDGTVKYAKSNSNTAPTSVNEWQDELEFTALSENTPYYFFAKITGGSYYVDAVSDGVPLTPGKPVYTGGGSSRPSFTEQAIYKVKRAMEGDTVKLNLADDGKLPGKVLEETAGKNVTLEISAGEGVTWVFNGMDIPAGKSADLNLKVDVKTDTIPVNVINSLTGEHSVMQLTLYHSGEFGFPLTLRLDIGKENAGLFANLYYCNETSKELKYQTVAEIGADGTADIPFAHASKYAIVIDTKSHGWQNTFTDVAYGNWFYDAVAYVHQKNLMVGVTDTAFDPDGAVTRAQVWTVLARLDGQKTGGGSPWYAPARDRVMKSGVSDGTNPDGIVLREELVTMLYRYAQNAGMDVSVGGNTNILSYDDAFDVSEWAIPAFQWMCGTGIISGTGESTLSPQTEITRAQLASILQRFSDEAV